MKNRKSQQTHTQNHNTVLTTKQLASYGRLERAQKIMQCWIEWERGKAKQLYSYRMRGWGADVVLLKYIVLYANEVVFCIDTNF